MGSKTGLLQALTAKNGVNSVPTQGLKWRRRRDSNPRYGFRPYNGLANRRLQPLGHISGPNKGRHSCPSLVPCSSQSGALIPMFYGEYYCEITYTAHFNIAKLRIGAQPDTSGSA